MFRFLFGILGLWCITGSTFIMSFLADTPESVKGARLAANAMLFVVALVCAVSMRTSALDAKERLDARVAKIDTRIAPLRLRREKMIPVIDGGES